MRVSFRWSQLFDFRNSDTRTQLNSGNDMCLILHQDGRVVKALDLRSNGRIVRVGSNPTPGNIFIPTI